MLIESQEIVEVVVDGEFIGIFRNQKSIFERAVAIAEKEGVALTKKNAEDYIMAAVTQKWRMIIGDPPESYPCRG